MFAAISPIPVSWDDRFKLFGTVLIREFGWETQKICPNRAAGVLPKMNDTKKWGYLVSYLV